MCQAKEGCYGEAMGHRPPRKSSDETEVIADFYVADPEQERPDGPGPGASAVVPTTAAGGGVSGPRGVGSQQVEGSAEGANFGGEPSEAKPAVDPRDLQVHREQAPRDVPYLPTDQHVVNKMMEMAKVTKADVLYDLGCGDGRICITAARLGARAVGIEIDLLRLRECHDNLRKTELKHLVEFRRQSFFDVDLRPATVVALYLLPAINRKLRPKMMHELRPGARIIANYFEIADWPPDEQIIFKHRPVMLWIVPAWVEGVWRCMFRTLAGTVCHAELRLARTFQTVSGTVRCGKKTYRLIEGRMRGATALLRLPAIPGLGHPVEIEAVYDDGASRKTTAILRGKFTGPKEADLQGYFAARRIEGVK